MTVTEFRFKDSRKIKWMDEKFNECSIVKTGKMRGEFKDALVELGKVIAFHLDLPADRTKAIGLIRTNKEGFDAFTLVGELYSECVDDGNAVYARKLRKAPYRFFPASYDGIDYYDEDGKPLIEADIHLPFEHRKYLTNDEWDLCEKLMMYAGEYATAEDVPEDLPLFENTQEEEVEVDDEESEEEE